MRENLSFGVGLIWLSMQMAVPAIGQRTDVEYLPVCAKCLSPRVTAKTGIGTVAAAVEAKVVAEDAKAWCGANRPRDAYCATEEVKNGGDGRRSSYRASADCTSGRLMSMDGYQYTYAGVWADGGGRGRPMFRDAGGNIPRWESIVSGTGKPRADWDVYGGLSLSGQWAVLCAGAAPPPSRKSGPGGSAPPAVALRPASYAAPEQPPAAPVPVCGGDVRCAEVNSFAARIIDFRTSNVGRTKVVTAAVRFQNKLARPVILGYVGGSGVTTDDQGNRYTAYGADSVRGIGSIGNGQVDPKFIIRPGESGDARFEMVWGWSGREIFGLTFDLELTVREMAPTPSGQYRLGPEHPLRFRGLSNAASAGGAVMSAAPTGVPAQTAVSSSPAQAASEAPPAPARDNCAGVAHCFDTGAFTAEIQQVSSSIYGGRHHILRFNVRLRNVSNQALILASTHNSHVVVDNTGGRYSMTPDQSVAGMGVVSGNRADPQFVLSPGQARNGSFQVYRRNTGAKPPGTVFTFDTSIEQLEILASQQIRSIRQFTLNFPDLRPTGMASAAPAENLNDASKRVVELFKGKKR